MRTIAVYGSAAALITAGLVFFGSQGGQELAERACVRLQSHNQYTAPGARPSYGSPTSHNQPNVSQSDVPWSYDFRDHGRLSGLSEEQCATAFPKLYHEVDRAVAYRKQHSNVTIEELDTGWRGDGIVRAMIYENQLYIIEAHGVWDRNHRPRSIATLHALNRAITASNEPLPNIEFTLTDHDSPLRKGDGNHTTWAYARLAQHESLWLMPDFGFWGWPDVGLRSYRELQAILDEEEDEFLDKVPKLVWRGSMRVGSGHDAREGLLEHSKDQPWSDVQTLDWDNKTDIAEKLLTMEEHCGYMFAATTEGNTYSGRFKYLLNCHSVVMSHELQWIEHFHHLLEPSGPYQNYVKLKRDFSDLPKKMKTLGEFSNMQTTERIADNARETFRDRYLTPAAEACYWRAMIRGWASVQGFTPQAWEDRGVEDDWRGGKRAKRSRRGAPFESYVIMEQVEWDIPAKPRRVCIDE